MPTCSACSGDFHCGTEREPAAQGSRPRVRMQRRTQKTGCCRLWFLAGVAPNLREASAGAFPFWGNCRTFGRLHFNCAYAKWRGAGGWGNALRFPNPLHFLFFSPSLSCERLCSLLAGEGRGRGMGEAARLAKTRPQGETRPASAGLLKTPFFGSIFSSASGSRSPRTTS